MAPVSHVLSFDMKTPTYSEFVLRRLHSLTGVIPLTFFIFFHFFANSFSIQGPEAFDTVVAGLRGLPFLLAIEWAFLFAPFLFHMLYGMWIIFAGRPNGDRMRFRRNWAYTAQRVTAMFVFVFIIYHVVGIRFIDTHGITNVHDALRIKFSHPFTFWFYIFGIACTVFHLANGVCTFLMTWGITVNKFSQRLAAYAMTVVGIALFFLGAAAMYGFVKEPAKPASSNAHASVSAAAPSESR